MLEKHVSDFESARDQKSSVGGQYILVVFAQVQHDCFHNMRIVIDAQYAWQVGWA